MSADPAFAATLLVGSAIMPTFGTTTPLTAPANVASIVTAGAAGAKIEAITLQGLGTTVADVVTTFRYDGSTLHAIDQWLITAVTASTILTAYQSQRFYDRLFLAANDVLKVAHQVTGNDALIKATAFGGSL